MKRFYQTFSILVIFLLVFTFCSSVKTRTVNLTKPLDEQSKTEKSEIKKEQELKRMKSKYHNRYDDTTVVFITSEKKHDSEVPDNFNQALQFFDDGNYREAEKIFSEIIQTIEKPNLKYYNIQFYLAECLIQFGENNKAEELLKQLTEKSTTDHLVLEKSIVRLGQLYCIMDKKDLATGYFQRLKREFPESDYLKFADCNVIK
jgi:TolA-binding protein